MIDGILVISCALVDTLVNNNLRFLITHAKKAWRLFVQLNLK